ncbi:amidohydrolase [Litoribaculum gwangyangense]|uniref:M20 family metallopeptidase n=1 Tax=Litoribaculum gwangyangense TaxID=1130722 RepID=A0ABP9CRI1_9FLAO
MKNILIYSIVFLFSTYLKSQNKLDNTLKDLDSKTTFYGSIAHSIWNYAEMGYQEEKSSLLLQKTLKDEGFKITSGVARIPTAFIAEYGTGSPIIAILGEYDALPGLSQKALPERVSDNKDAGHACGHHLFGTASTAAAISVKNWLKENKISGTIRFYGCPAEEGGSGKVYMTREGLFKDVDIALHWHADSKNHSNPIIRLANKSAKFRFYGVSAHASSAPEKGRSALDAVESMNFMVNMMREHMPQEARIHYVITEGGKAPNVVPDFAEVYYYSRHPDREEVVKLFDRIVKAAEGAAIGTDTTMNYEIIGGTYDLLPNLTLQKLMYDNFVKIGGYTYDSDERSFAEKINKTLGQETLDLKYVEGVMPYNLNPTSKGSGSTDVGDVSYNVATGGIRAATWVPNTPSHSWQAVAAGGMSIGTKGMMLAAKTLAATAIDLFSNKDIVVKAKSEFLERRGDKFEYIPLIGDRLPALNYRN